MLPRPLASFVLLILASSQALAHQTPTKPAVEKPAETKKAADGLIVTKHKLKQGATSFEYTATAGLLPIKDEKGETEAHIFFVAYTRDDQKDATKRPLMFSFNGGPGSASLWLHLGAVGPKVVEMPDAKSPKPPYRLLDNPETWLDKTDLVFIDPVGTGFSRAVKPDLNKKFHSVAGDVKSVGEFIRLYLTRNERWASPLFIVGESYGTTRAAALSSYLFENGIALNGVALISTVLSFQTLQFDKGNDLPYVLYLPTYTASAFYHKKLPAELSANLKAAIDESRKFAQGEYLQALQKGAALSDGERKAVAAKLARLTGLSQGYVEQNDLRVPIQRFCKELLRDKRLAVGRFDSRYTGFDISTIAPTPEFDPSYSAIRPAYTSTINDYLRRELKYETDLPYYVLGEGVGAWDWALSGRGGYPDVAESLQASLAKNPAMKVYVASGYYDLATPFSATEYTLDHVQMTPESRKNVTISEFEAGHMMYLHPASLKKLKKEIGGFIEGAIAR